MYHHHIKKEFTKAGQVNPELIFEKMGTMSSQPVLWCWLIGVLGPDSVHKYNARANITPDEDFKKDINSIRKKAERPL